MGKYKFKNRKFPKSFQKVSDYIQKEKGYNVVLEIHTYFGGYFNREIFIHHNFDLTRNGLYMLLHECGHVFQPATNVGINSFKNYNISKNSDKYYMGKFLQEVDAWTRGLKIAEKLHIPINKKEYNKIKEEYLLTYFDTK